MQPDYVFRITSVQGIETSNKDLRAENRDLKAQLQCTSERKDELEILAKVYKREIADLKLELRLAGSKSSQEQRQSAQGQDTTNIFPSAAEPPCSAHSGYLYDPLLKLLLNLKAKQTIRMRVNHQ
jgi:hypothetical protein